MQLEIFSELMTDRLGGPKEFNVAFENVGTSHVKDNYDEIWTDFIDEDISNALKHAKQELEHAVSDDSDRKKHLKNACLDLKNYLMAASGLAREHLNTPNFINPTEDYEEFVMWDRDAEKLISALASFEDKDVDEWITDVIWTRFRPDDEYDPRESFQPNYRELYQEIGDVALFYRGDVERALLWYALMPIDWEGLEDEVDEELEQDEIQIKKQNKWWDSFNQKVEPLVELSHNNMFHTSLIFGNTLDMSDKCEEKLQAYLSAWGSYQEGIDDDCAQQIWSRAVDYCNEVKGDLANAKDYSDETVKKRLRTEVAFARIMIDQAKYYYLVALANVEGELSDTQVEEARTILSHGDLGVDKAKPIEKYLRKKVNAANNLADADVQKVLRIVKAISSSDKILSVLNEGIFSGRVAYYTSLNTLKKMLPDTADAPANVGRFAVMHVAYMNDPNEGRTLGQWVFDRETERNVYGRQQADYPYVFIKCFTTRIDDLPMWEMYGDHAKGCCIIIDMGKIMKSEKKIYPVYNVCYVKKSKDGTFDIESQDNQSISPEGINILKQTIIALINIRCKNIEDIDYQEALQEVLSRVTYLFKKADYSYECEKRIIYFVTSGLSNRIRQTVPNADGDSPLLYVLSDMNAYIDEIILGPKAVNSSWEIPYLQKSLDKMNKEIGNHDTIAISYSDISYR